MPEQTTPTIRKITADDPLATSADVVAQNIATLKALFPELITEGEKGASVNLDVLKQLVGDQTVTDAEEKFGLNWHGKRRARQLALTPSTGTLRPCPDESVDWDTTQNIFIEGDNLEVLKLLQKSYAGRVKMIYIDPPYNTGNDFIYPDDFRDGVRHYLKAVGQLSSEGLAFSSNTDAGGRFHTNWLNMMYPRLRLAKNLLRRDGAVFVSLDDNEIASLRAVCDDIFGEENFVATLIWQKVFSPKNTAKHFSVDHDYIVCYAADKAQWAPTLLARTQEATDRYENPDNDPRGPWSSSDVTARNYYSDGQYTVTGPTGKTFGPGRGRYWRSNLDTFKELDRDNRIWWGADGGNMPRLKRFLSEVKAGVVPQTLLLHTNVGNTQEAKKELLEFAPFQETENVLNSVKPTRLIRHLLKVATEPNAEDIVLDFFAGSGPTGHAVLAQNQDDGGNRRFVLVQLPEPLPKPEAQFRTIADLAKVRMRTFAKQSAESLTPGDRGFRVFRLDASCVTEWSGSAEELTAAVLAGVDHIKPDRNAADVLCELLLKRGLDLCVPIEEKLIAGKRVRSVGAGTLMACLDSRIAREESEALALGIAQWHKELNPAGDTAVIFRDDAFADDVVKTNVAAILEQHGLKNVRSL